MAVVLTVPARRSRDGRSPVTDDDGTVVATLSPPSRHYRFDVEDAAGTTLCRGGVRRFHGWEVLDPDGAVLARMGAGLFGRFKITLRGGDLVLRLSGRAYRGNLLLVDPTGEALLQSMPSDEVYAIGDDWRIRSNETLSPAEALGVLEMHRLDLRRRRKPTPRQQLRAARRRG